MRIVVPGILANVEKVFARVASMTVTILRMAQKPETKFRNNYVIPFLKTLKMTMYFPIQQLAIHDDPDFLLSIRGSFVALELKDREGKVRPLQEYKLNQVRRTGGVALVADQDNWNTIKQILSAMDKGEKWQQKR